MLTSTWSCRWIRFLSWGWLIQPQRNMSIWMKMSVITRLSLQISVCRHVQAEDVMHTDSLVAGQRYMVLWWRCLVLGWWLCGSLSWIKHGWECCYIPCECTYKVWHMQGATCTWTKNSPESMSQVLQGCLVCLFTVMQRAGLSGGVVPLGCAVFSTTVAFWLCCVLSLLFCI